MPSSLKNEFCFAKDNSFLPAGWRGVPSHPWQLHPLRSKWEMSAASGSRAWYNQLRWDGDLPVHTPHWQAAAGEPGLLAQGSPMFALQGHLLPPSPCLRAILVTGTQPQTVSCYSCFIHLLLSSAVLQKLLPNYAAFFFFFPSIINFFSRVESFPDHPPPTYTHACTHTL